MQFKWINKIVVTSLVSVAVLFQSVLAKERASNRNTSSAARSAIATTGVFDGNRVRDDLENNGMIVSHRISGIRGWSGQRQLHIFGVCFWCLVRW